MCFPLCNCEIISEIFRRIFYQICLLHSKIGTWDQFVVSKQRSKSLSMPFWSFMRNLRAIAISSLVLYGILVAATNGWAAFARWNRDSQAEDSVSKWEKR